jgi:hypothetical protein
MRRKKPRMEKMKKAMKRCTIKEECTSTGPINNGTEVQPFEQSIEKGNQGYKCIA